MDDVVSVSAGEYHILAVKADGSLWGWNYRSNNESPIKITEDVASVSVSNLYNYSALVVKTDGTLWTCKEVSQTDGTYKLALHKKMMYDVAAAVAGYKGSYFAIKKDGTLWAWGGNEYGELGNGTEEKQDAPVKIMDDVDFVVSGYNCSYAVKKDKTLWAWGYNGNGAVGNGIYENQLTPVKIMDDVAFVSACHSCCAIKTDGTLWTWGRNESGQLGDGTEANKTKPVKIMNGVKSAFVSEMEHLLLRRTARSGRAATMRSVRSETDRARLSILQ